MTPQDRCPARPAREVGEGKEDAEGVIKRGCAVLSEETGEPWGWGGEEPGCQKRLRTQRFPSPPPHSGCAPQHLAWRPASLHLASVRVLTCVCALGPGPIFLRRVNGPLIPDVLILPEPSDSGSPLPSDSGWDAGRLLGSLQHTRRPLTLGSEHVPATRGAASPQL